MRERGTEVVDLHEMLAETLADKAARGLARQAHRQRRRLGGLMTCAHGSIEMPAEAGRAPDRRYRHPDLPKSERKLMLAEAF